MVKIAIIIGSVRPNRFGATAGAWIHDIATQYAPDTEFTLVDLAEINLPFLDEPQPPSAGDYQQAHTKEWSRIIDEHDGFVLVTSEYNHSYAPALKNALDFVYREWHHKPVSFVSYGANEGGARAVEHLRGVVAWLKMYSLAEFVAIHSYYTQFNESGEFVATDAQQKAAQTMLDQLVFWADKMKSARAELAAK